MKKNHLPQKWEWLFPFAARSGPCGIQYCWVPHVRDVSPVFVGLICPSDPHVCYIPMYLYINIYIYTFILSLLLLLLTLLFLIIIIIIVIIIVIIYYELLSVIINSYCQLLSIIIINYYQLFSFIIKYYCHHYYHYDYD